MSNLKDIIKEKGITEEQVEMTMRRIFELIDSHFVIVNGVTQTQIALISAALNLSDAFHNGMITENILRQALAEMEKDRYVANGNKLN